MHQCFFNKMAECFPSELNKNINTSFKQSSEDSSCQEVETEEGIVKFIVFKLISLLFS